MVENKYLPMTAVQMVVLRVESRIVYEPSRVKERFLDSTYRQTGI